MKTAADANVSFDPESTEIVVQAHDVGARVMVTWLGAWSASKKSMPLEASHVVMLTSILQLLSWFTKRTKLWRKKRK
jgi:inosine-uridine nucleoside N-ribohydrolase